jgi:hypothetical protein
VCNFYKIAEFLLQYNNLYPAVRLINFVSAVFSILISLSFNAQISQPYKSDGMVKILYNN